MRRVPISKSKAPRDTTHKFFLWIERKPGTVLDQLQISESRLGEGAKSLCTVGLSATEYVTSMQRGGAPYIFRGSIHSTAGKLNSANFVC